MLNTIEIVELSQSKDAKILNVSQSDQLVLVEWNKEYVVWRVNSRGFYSGYYTTEYNKAIKEYYYRLGIELI